MSVSPVSLPVDETSRAKLAADGLTMARLDASDHAAYEAWFRAEARGFMGPSPSTELIDQRRGYLSGDDRIIGVWDRSVADPATPVATAVSWIADLTVPGGSSVPTWAISGVSVAPTHRRRGIARALLESELRTAVALDLPVAMLTVSEATIYGRFGFAPAAMARDLTIDARRARWTGPEAPGRVHFVTAEQLRVSGHSIVERERAMTAGQVHYAATSVLWDRQLGLMVGDDNAKNLRFVRYDDVDGTPHGFAIYQVVPDETDFTHHNLKLHTLVSTSPDAYAGLWRFLLEMDLVATITAQLRPVDEPLRWMVADFRAIRVSENDHLWTRVLDVRRALASRTYRVPGRLVVAVTDELGFADGTWAIEVDALGSAQVTAVDEPAESVMSVNALSAMYLGGVSSRPLAAAGLLSGDAGRVDAMFRSPAAPYLSIWF